MKRDKNGRFVKGGHWRKAKPYWNKKWLYSEYITKKKPAAQIAAEQGCKENNILYFLHKHGIPRRTTQEVRQHKHWGPRGKKNPMYNRRGAKHPNWKGGITPERQAFYSSEEWAAVVKAVWKRDKGFCQRCGEKNTKQGYMHIHHIVFFMCRTKSSSKQSCTSLPQMSQMGSQQEK
jgi:hypothetical protein